MSRSARKISQTFNGRNEWLIGGGGFFKLLATINPVDVEIYDKGGVRLVAAQVEGGFYQRIDFDRVVITTGANELVEWMFAPDEGGSDRFTGVVDVSDDAARQLGVVTLSGFTYGATFLSTAGLLANANEQVVAPAANVNGLILWDATIQSAAANSKQVILLAKASAPAAFNDGDPLMLGSGYGTGFGPNCRLGAPRAVSAGKGLYFRNDGTAETQAGRMALYTLL